jgi:hypothetical protein
MNRKKKIHLSERLVLFEGVKETSLRVQWFWSFMRLYFVTTLPLCFEGTYLDTGCFAISHHLDARKTMWTDVLQENGGLNNVMTRDIQIVMSVCSISFVQLLMYLFGAFGGMCGENSCNGFFCCSSWHSGFLSPRRFSGGQC